MEIGTQTARPLLSRTHLGVDLGLAERGGGGGAALLDDALLLLVGVEDLQKGLVDVGVLLEAILRERERRPDGYRAANSFEGNDRRAENQSGLTPQN